jgi:hypothetical protein
LQQSFPCPKCGNQIPIGQYYCDTCGQRFEYRCHACGTPISGTSGFCSNCGKKLTNLPQHVPAPPLASKQTQYSKTPITEHATKHRVGAVGRYLIIVAFIFLMVGIVYVVGASTQDSSSGWMGGYSFGGQSPPSSPPPSTSGTVSQKDPKTASDLPSYTMNEVLELATQFSPDCRLLTRRTG